MNQQVNQITYKHCAAASCSSRCIACCTAHAQPMPQHTGQCHVCVCVRCSCTLLAEPAAGDRKLGKYGSVQHDAVAQSAHRYRGKRGSSWTVGNELSQLLSVLYKKFKVSCCGISHSTYCRRCPCRRDRAAATALKAELTPK